MLAELSHLALFCALALCLFVIVSPQLTANILALKRSLHLIFILTLFSFISLIVLFYFSDFSVRLVVAHSASDTPALYRISASWGNHEGSLLLWCLILSLYGVLLAQLPPSTTNVTAWRIHCLFMVLFLLLLLTFSNPFERLMPVALEGRGLNPLLQHPALALHPPLLYGGYVGLSALASLAFAHLLHPHSNAKEVIGAMRPLALLSFSLLTIGIALGSWWAYYELGWGGFWFWDPVENASFIPWCASVALIHNLALANKDSSSLRLTLPLALVAFGFAITGTFLVRSGIITSVHSFAADPNRGIFILSILALYSLSAIILYALRLKHLPERTFMPLQSRHSMMTLQSTLFISLGACVLLGTFYPILSQQEVSVGPPYYIYCLMLLGLPLALLMGLAPYYAWHKNECLHAFFLRLMGVCVFIVMLAIAWMTERDTILAVMGIGASAWIMLTTLGTLLHKKIHRPLPMILAHSGIALVFLAATAASVWQTEKIQFQKLGEESPINSWTMTLQDVQNIWQDNYIATRGVIIAQEGTDIIVLHPERRFYPERRTITTESAVHSTPLFDLYVAFSEPVTDTDNIHDSWRDSWTTRYWMKPLIMWLWVGAMLISLGGLLAILKQRQK